MFAFANIRPHCYRVLFSSLVGPSSQLMLCGVRLLREVITICCPHNKNRGSVMEWTPAANPSFGPKAS